jgi:nascent polypeptide-associated complex subunit beta
MRGLRFLGRKKKAVHKTATTDDKRLQSTLKRVGVNTIPAIEEVNIFKDDLVIQFANPKGSFFSISCSCCFGLSGNGNALLTDLFAWCVVQASIAANTWVVSGTPQTKSMDLLAFLFHNLVMMQVTRFVDAIALRSI